MEKSCSNCKYAEVCSPDIIGDLDYADGADKGFCQFWCEELKLESCLCERILEAIVNFLRRLLDAVEFKLLDFIWKWLYRK